MDDLVLHPQVDELIKKLVSQPTHALLLVGPFGAGKSLLARHILAAVLRLDGEARLDAHPYVKTLQPVKGVTSIDAVRALHEFVRLKTTGQDTFRRGIIIEDAHTLTIEAQNALLKLLEEPPADTILILTATDNRSLLPTIISRSQYIAIKTPSLPAYQKYFQDQGYNEEDIKRLYLLSDGRAALLTALLAHKSDHPLAGAIETAKKILTAKTFERMCLADTLSKQKEGLEDLLYGLQQICHVALTQAAQKKRKAEVNRWLQRLESTIEARSRLVHNPQVKMLLTDLFIAL